MRGKVICNVNMSKDDRITPAYAGKSALYADYEPLHKDHPRLCGEKSLIDSIRS